MEASSLTAMIPPGLPYDPFRTSLYTREELIDDGVDARVEQHVLEHGFRAPPAEEALAQRLHDHALDTALARWLSAREDCRVVGIMGAATTLRTDPWYRRVVELGRMLARRGFLVASGGGPGLMEAANLGAFLAPHDDVTTEEALAALAASPDWESDREGYVRVASELRRRLGDGGESLAIPTWFYPGEPVGQFSTLIAKYFANSIREDGLLAISVSGVVFAPGRAGTMQELFQDAAQNAYGIRGQSPMVLLGREYYGANPSIAGILKREARRFGGFDHLIELCDEPREAIEFVERHQQPEALAGLAATPGEVLDFLRNQRMRAR